MPTSLYVKYSIIFQLYKLSWIVINHHAHETDKKAVRVIPHRGSNILFLLAHIKTRKGYEA